MKRELFFIMMLFLILITAILFVHSIEESTSTTINLESLSLERIIFLESNEVGNTDSNHPISNLTDGNFTTFAGTLNNATFFYINYSKLNFSAASTKVQVHFNTTTGSLSDNYTLSDFPNCFESDPEKVILRFISNSTQNVTNSIIFENFTWLNNTPVSLSNTRIVSGIVFNITIRINITNETNQAGNDLVWVNDTNMTLLNTNLVDTTTVRIYNCTTPYTEVGGGNFTAFNNGKVFVTDNSTVSDGEEVCANYTYHGLGFGDEIGSNNYTLDYLSGNITLTSNLHNNTLMGINYTYYTDDTPFNRKDCFNGSDWLVMNTSVGRMELFDVRLYWNISSAVLNFSFDNLVPGAYSNQNVTSILFNITTLNLQNNTNINTWNCSLYTKDNRNDNFTVNGNASDIFMFNGSYFNQSITFAEGRHWWKWVCEDEYERTIGNSSFRFFDIDENYEDMNVFMNLNLTGFNLYVDGCIKYNCSQVTGCTTLGICI